MTWDKIVKMLAAIGGAAVGLVGGWDTMLMVLAVFMGIDYITGLMAGALGKSSKTETGHIDSSVAWKGLVKKAGELLAVVVGVMLDKLAMEAMGYSQPIFRSGVMLYIIATEGISVAENLGSIGVPLPPILMKALEQLQHKADSQDGGDGE